ncbi:MAG: GntR family transcriptional regulator [Bacteroidetes bacterium]|nr:GntR family transcriptional regulator [Bacteroidota bacterium]
MLEIGRLNTLEIISRKPQGLYLDGGRYGEILIPNQYIPRDVNVGDEIEVFIYFDSEDRIIATTRKPLVMIGEFAMLRCISVSTVGAFMDWGLQKDLLVPYSEQKSKMVKDMHYLVHVHFDEVSKRIVASAKLDKYLDKSPINFKEWDQVDLIITKETELGYKAIINNTHWGVIYKNEVFKKIEYGQKLKGFVKKIRVDGKIDLSLEKLGYGKVDPISQEILDKLNKNEGFIPVTDKSSPETIAKLFGLSKKNYKKAVGALYKQKLIIIEEKGIRLVKEEVR